MVTTLVELEGRKPQGHRRAATSNEIEENFGFATKAGKSQGRCVLWLRYMKSHNLIGILKIHHNYICTLSNTTTAVVYDSTPSLN